MYSVDTPVNSDILEILPSLSPNFPGTIPTVNIVPFAANLLSFLSNISPLFDSILEILTLSLFLS